MWPTSETGAAACDRRGFRESTPRWLAEQDVGVAWLPWSAPAHQVGANEIPLHLFAREDRGACSDVFREGVHGLHHPLRAAGLPLRIMRLPYRNDGGDYPLAEMVRGATPMFEASPAEAVDYIHEQLKELAQIAQRCDLESLARMIQMAALEAQLQWAFRRPQAH